MDENSIMLTTVDNPFSPFDEFDEWFRFDVEKGYYSCSKLARLVNINEDDSEKEIDNAIEDAIDRLIQHDFTDTFKKVTPNDYNIPKK